MEPKIKILHLEDLPTDAGLVKRQLEKGNINFELLLVDKRESFERALKEFVPDIILSDHSLPSFNSVEALRIVQEAGIRVPFILITATISEEFAVQMMKAGVTDYILKDRLQRLPTAVTNALEIRRLDRERQEFLYNIIANESLMKETERLAHIGSFHADLIRQTTKWSDEYFRIMGFKPGEVAPSVENFLKRVHPGDMDEVRSGIEYATKHSEHLTREFRLKIGDSVKYIFSEIIIERDISGKAVGITGFNQDITPMKMAEMEIKALNDSLEKKVAARTAELAEANNELEAFNHTVSHDLRSPLQVISGYCTVLTMKHSKSLPEDAQVLITGIKDYALHMGRVIEDLLYLSKVGHDQLVRNAVDMRQGVEKVINELKKSIPGYHAEINFTDLKPAHCDGDLIHHVWLNLVGNAIKYSAKKEKPVIEIGTKNMGGKETYYVSDNGAGFDMKYADKLFKVFQRLHSSSEYEGTGVGLALVHRIVTKHGGKIWAEGKVNEGATFYFTLD